MEKEVIMLAELGGLGLGTVIAQGVTAVTTHGQPKEVKVKAHKSALAGSLILGGASWLAAAVAAKIADN